MYYQARHQTDLRQAPPRQFTFSVRVISAKYGLRKQITKVHNLVENRKWKMENGQIIKNI